MRAGDGTFLQSYFMSQFSHSPQKDIDVVLPALMNQVEATEVSALALLDQIASQVVSDCIGNVICRHHQKCMKGVLQRDQVFLLSVYLKHRTSYSVVGGNNQDLESVRHQEVLPDNVVSCVEGEQLGKTGDVMRLAVLVTLNDHARLHIEYQPLLRSYMRQSIISKHFTSTLNPLQPQLYSHWVGQNCLAMTGFLIFESAHRLTAQRDFASEEFRVVSQGSQMKNSLMEKHFVILVALSQFLGDISIQPFQRE